MENIRKESLIPLWQRRVCGVLALLGAIAFLMGLLVFAMDGHLPSWPSLITMGISVPYGVYLFAHVALRGEMPRHFHKQNAAK